MDSVKRQVVTERMFPMSKDKMEVIFQVRLDDCRKNRETAYKAYLKAEAELRAVEKDIDMFLKDKPI